MDIIGAMARAQWLPRITRLSIVSPSTHFIYFAERLKNGSNFPMNMSVKHVS